jgi:hypothetical protein
VVLVILAATFSGFIALAVTYGLVELGVLKESAVVETGEHQV